MRKLLPLVLWSFMFAACATTHRPTKAPTAEKPSSRDPALGGLATATAVAAAVPLLPVGVAYNVATGRVLAGLPGTPSHRSHSDFIYGLAIQELSEHDPRADARAALKQGPPAFLARNGFSLRYPGLDNDARRRIDLYRNMEYTEKNPVVHRAAGFTQHADNSKYPRYVALRQAYQAAFNQEMWARVDRRSDIFRDHDERE